MTTETGKGRQERPARASRTSASTKAKPKCPTGRTRDKASRHTGQGRTRDAGTRVTYSDKVAATLCERIAEGESLTAACKDRGMPTRQAVYAWLAENDAFRRMYAIARQQAADKFGADVIEIADGAAREDVDKARLRIQARQWTAGRMAPRAWGDRLATEISGPDGGPLQLDHGPSPEDEKLASESLKCLTDDELDAYVAINEKLAAEQERLRTLPNMAK